MRKERNIGNDNRKNEDDGSVSHTRLNPHSNPKTPLKPFQISI